jgi:1,4-alpha-glucan branching enzyme
LDFCKFRYQVTLNSDSKSFDGLGRVNDKQVFLTEDIPWDERPFSFKIYTPCRTVLVLALSGDVK